MAKIHTLVWRCFMIKYKIDVLEALKEAGYNTNVIRQKKLLGEKTLQYIRDGKMIGITSIDTVCALLNCQPGDIVEWIPDNPVIE